MSALLSTSSQNLTPNLKPPSVAFTTLSALRGSKISGHPTPLPALRWPGPRQTPTAARHQDLSSVRALGGAASPSCVPGPSLLRTSSLGVPEVPGAADSSGVPEVPCPGIDVGGPRGPGSSQGLQPQQSHTDAAGGEWPLDRHATQSEGFYTGAVRTDRCS